jgi:hypothetical protein
VNAIGFSPEDERWLLMAVLTWIATRSQKFAERWAYSDPATAGRCLDDARKKDGAPYHISYADAFHALLEKSRSRDIAGSGSKIAWTAAADHEHLPLEQSFALAKSSTIFEACHFSPQEALNANYSEGHTLGLQDFTFHGKECLTCKGSGCGPPNLNGSRTRWTWKSVTFPRRRSRKAASNCTL